MKTVRNESPYDDIVTKRESRNGIVVVNRIQDVEPYIKQNRERQRDFVANRNAARRMVADVPNIVIEQWFKMGINVFDPNTRKKIQQMLNSNEYKDFRTSPGKCKV